jgi:mono/diheme cytochrome c family protein
MRSVSLGLIALALSYFITSASTADPPNPWKAPPRAAAAKNPVPANDKSVGLGKSIYAKECAACHGAVGRGDGPDAKDLSRPPSDLTAPTTRQQSDGELFWKLTEGRRPMPRFGRTLSDEQRWHVVNYIRTLQPQHP